VTVADPEKRIVVEEVEFGELFQFPRILRAVTMAFQPPRLVLGLALVAALMTVGRLWDGVTRADVSPRGLLAGTVTAADEAAVREVFSQVVRAHVPQEGWPDALADAEAMDARGVVGRIEDAHRAHRREIEDDAAREAADDAFAASVRLVHDSRPRGTFESTVTHVAESFSRLVEGFVSLQVTSFFTAAGDLFVRTPVTLWAVDPLFTVIYGLVFLTLIALAGGALTRMTAVELASGDKMRLNEAIDFAARGSRRLVLSLILPLLIAAALCAILVLAGWLLMLPGIDLLGGILYGIALLIGFGVVFLLVGYGVGFSLLVPAVACENCDAADAQQRAYAYVLSRPLHLAGYAIVAMAGLALGFVVVSLFAGTVLNVTGGLVGAWTGNPAMAAAQGFSPPFDLTPDPATIPFRWDTKWSSGLVSFWQTIVIGLVAAYVFSYYFAASACVYLLMRRACDGQETTEIWQPGEVPGTSIEEEGTE
jgi:hypothetical protein